MNIKMNPYSRKLNQREVRKILIVCEGEQTEPNYFDAFKTNDELLVVDVNRAGLNKLRLVEYAAKLKRGAELRKVPYSIVWCVLDRDSRPDDPTDKSNFNKAIGLAKKSQIKVAYSNDAFEIWYILHFSYHTAGWHRSQYQSKLTELLGSKYKKNCREMYSVLKEKQATGINNAKRLMALYNPLNPESDNPSTTVHLLVEYLNEYLE